MLYGGRVEDDEIHSMFKKKIVHTIDLIASPPNDADAENNLSFLP